MLFSKNYDVDHPPWFVQRLGNVFTTALYNRDKEAGQ